MNPTYLLLAPIALIVCIVGGAVWIIATREWKGKDATIAKMGEYGFALGLGFALYFYGGR